MIYNQANTGMPGRIVYDVARRPSEGLIAIANNQPETFPYTGGVSTFDGTTWRHYTPNNSPLTHWQVVAVEFDANGNLWASPLSEGMVQIIIDTNTDANGLAQLPHRQLLRVQHQLPLQRLPRRQGLAHHQGRGTDRGLAQLHHRDLDSTGWSSVADKLIRRRQGK